MDEKTFNLTDSDKKFLLNLARNTIQNYLQNKNVTKIDESFLSVNVKQKCGAFVTLHLHKNLRGCIGRFNPDIPLYRVVQEMAIASATEDYRFEPLTFAELPLVEIEISVLTPMKKIKSIDEIKLGTHGIYIKKGYNSGTFLPQVATETKWNLEEFLGHCSRDKAGIGWTGWKDADIYTYEAIIFSEEKTV